MFRKEKTALELEARAIWDSSKGFPEE